MQSTRVKCSCDPHGLKEGDVVIVCSRRMDINLAKYAVMVRDAVTPLSTLNTATAGFRLFDANKVKAATNYHYQKVDTEDTKVKAEIAAQLLEVYLTADVIQWQCPAARDVYNNKDNSRQEKSCFAPVSGTAGSEESG